VDRTRAWLAVSPLVATGVLVAHALAYRLTGTPNGSVHEYLDHAPQVLLVLAAVGLMAAGLATRLRPLSTWPFPAVALATYVVQEHLERIAHDGQLSLLVTSPAFLIGILLQLPFALVVWALARVLLAALAELEVRLPRVGHLVLVVDKPVSRDIREVPFAPLPARGPPVLHRR
jgi:hypothetical protein